MPDDDQDRNTCNMVGLLGILIQVGLGLLSFSVLIIKRYFEHPKRPWKIWTLDASKQIISQLIAHFINLTISLALTYDQKNSDECLWYFVTNIFDNTMGVFICIVLLKLVENNLRKRRKIQLVSGNYYRKIDPLSLTRQSKLRKSSMNQQGSIHFQSTHPNTQIQPNPNPGPSLIQQGDSKIQAFNIELQSHQSKQSQSVKQSQSSDNNYIYLVDYKAWILQLGIWNGIVVLGKCALFGLQYGLEKQLQEFSMLILGWIQEYPVLELILVIVIVPVIMNALAYWVQDNFLMRHEITLEEKNLLEEHLKEDIQLNDEISGQGPYEDKSQKQNDKINQVTRPRKQSDFEANGNRFEFHDDYDAKDDQNPAPAKFDHIFEKFGKFTM